MVSASACPDKALQFSLPAFSSSVGAGGDFVRTDFVVTPSAALMFHHSAKHALSNGEGSRGVPGLEQFFPTTSGLELTGIVFIGFVWLELEPRSTKFMVQSSQFRVWSLEF